VRPFVWLALKIERVKYCVILRFSEESQCSVATPVTTSRGTACCALFNLEDLEHLVAVVVDDLDGYFAGLG